jgi:type IV secretory pathway TrbD component
MTNTNTSPRQIPLFQAGMRPKEWFGANRYLVAALLGLCSFFELFSIGQRMWIVTAGCPVVFFVSLWALRSFSQKDPHFFTVYWRATRHADYYPAKTSLRSTQRWTRKSWL